MSIRSNFGAMLWFDVAFFFFPVHFICWMFGLSCGNESGGMEYKRQDLRRNAEITLLRMYKTSSLRRQVSF